MAHASNGRKGGPAFQATCESRVQLLDDLILSRVRATIEQRFAGIDAQVKSGKVTLTGGSSDERMIVEVIPLVHTIEDVTGVESQIRHIAFQPST